MSDFRFAGHDPETVAITLLFWVLLMAVDKKEEVPIRGAAKMKSDQLQLMCQTDVQVLRNHMQITAGYFLITLLQR